MFLRDTVLAPLACLMMSPALTLSQTFIPTPEDVTYLQSKNYPDISISYKETTICETTPGVKAYSGFVTLPSIDNSYNASIFFWYFESRKDPQNAPTTIYIPGGPGESFLDGAGGLPCHVNEHANDTVLNPWSWNNVSNMLYLDIPVQTGYSYTEAQNGTFDLLTNAFTPAPAGVESVQTNLTSLAATLSSQELTDTVNTTAQVAIQTWQLAQAWFQEFPEYKTDNDQVNFWAYSYSGFFIPATVAYFQQQNERIENGTIEDKHAKKFNLGTLGVNNGCIDCLLQTSSWPEYAVNNTYDVKAISDEAYEIAMANLTKPDGCYDLIRQCRRLQESKDPQSLGNVPEVNQACAAATQSCFFEIQAAYTDASEYSAFDIALKLPGIFPSEDASTFYNQRWVQEELAVPVNFTLSGTTIPSNLFAVTGDPAIRSVKDLEYILSSGVNLALVYGDRDYRCNWFGVENVSLTMEYPSAPEFRSAGYQNIETNSSYIGGLVRQHGNVSFSRVFQAGHAVAAYQPETFYQIFERAILGKDIATGDIEVGPGGNYSSVGPSSCRDVKNKLPESPEPVCYIRAAGLTCSEEQLEALQDGSAVVVDSMVISPSSGNDTSEGNGGTGNDTNKVPKGTVKNGAAPRVLGVAPLLSAMLTVVWLMVYV